MEEDDIKTLQTEDRPGTDIMDMFRKVIPNSRAARVSLIFLKQFWKIHIDYEHRSDVNTVYPIMVHTKGKLLKESKIPYVCKRRETAFVFDNKIAVVAKSASKLPSRRALIDSAANVIDWSPSERDQDIDAFDTETAGFTAASYKSLLQKLIRFRPKKVKYRTGDSFDSEKVLIITMCTLAAHPGSFVPDIQRFVTGIESLFKRLVIIAFEDSYHENGADLLTLATCAFLAQRTKIWTPHLSQLLCAFRVGIELLNESRKTLYDVSSTVVPYSHPETDLEMVSLLIDTVRSFESDLNLIRDSVNRRQKGEPCFVDSSTQYQPRSMPLYHCVDQHWAPNFVLLYPIDYVLEYKETGSKPFGRLLTDVFKRVTGVNTRETVIDEKDVFVKHTRTAQMLYLMTLNEQSHQQSQQKQSQNKKTTFEYTLSDSWVAGMLGPIAVSRDLWVNVRTDDLYDFAVMRQPSRNVQDKDELTQDLEEGAIQKARTMLKKGIKISSAMGVPFPELKCSVVKLHTDGTYWITTNAGISRPWTEWKQYRKKVPEHKLSIVSAKRAILANKENTYNDCIAANWKDVISELFLGERPIQILRLLSYLRAAKSTIDIHRVSRDGGGTTMQVSLDDVFAYQHLLHISYIAPCAIRLLKGTSFEVRDGPILWTIVDYILGILNDMFERKRRRSPKLDIYDRRKRVLKPYQSDAIDEMIQRNAQRKTNHFLWLPVGSGKTLIVLSYLKYLHEMGKLPKYILYTCPRGAIKSIASEIEAFGYPVEWLVPLKSVPKALMESAGEKLTIRKGTSLSSHCVTIVEHDHLRLIGDVVIQKASQAFFVCDEVHKTLNDTLRTSVAVEIAMIAKETIALTGTPLIDGKIVKLTPWMSLINDFEVNEKNVWTSASSMCAKQFKLSVQINRVELYEKMKKLELLSYQEKVPMTLGGLLQRTDLAKLKEAFELCYDVCTRRMVKETMKRLERGGVFVVAKDRTHQMVLKEKFMDNGLREKDIALIGVDMASLHLTDLSVEKREVHDYKIVIAPLRLCEGYTLTRLKSIVMSVYPSNHASREQIQGRVIRTGQSAESVDVVVVITGLLANILENHNMAISMTAALQMLSTRA